MRGTPEMCCSYLLYFFLPLLLYYNNEGTVEISTLQPFVFVSPTSLFLVFYFPPLFVYFAYVSVSLWPVCMLCVWSVSVCLSTSFRLFVVCLGVCFISVYVCLTMPVGPHVYLNNVTLSRSLSLSLALVLSLSRARALSLSHIS